MSVTKKCTVIQTALGWIGLAWSESGVENLRLPERDRDHTAMRIRAKSGGEMAEVPEGLRPLVDDLVRYAQGERVDFNDVTLSLGKTDAFHQAIYAQALKLQYGETTTYGGLASAAGYAGMARETGQALGANPIPIIVPCHRIVAAGGKLGGFSAPGGAATKRRLLEMEHALPPPHTQQATFAF